MFVHMTVTQQSTSFRETTNNLAARSPVLNLLSVCTVDKLVSLFL